MTSDRELIKIIRDSAVRVFAFLGTGHSESVYHRAMEVELRGRGIKYASEVNVNILYEGIFVGFGRIDILIDDRLVIELKATTSLGIGERIQLGSYMDCLKINKGLLVNFPQPSKTSASGGKIEIEVLDKEEITDETRQKSPIPTQEKVKL